MSLLRRRSREGRDDLDDPMVSLLVSLADLALIAGGALAIVLIAGYAGAGRGFAVWGPDAAILLCLAMLDIALRGWRHHRRFREWQRFHSDDDDDADSSSAPQASYEHSTR
jgi:hypothetical protein